MAATRKDSRGYALRTGECQRADGRYSYSYTDKMGKRHSIYTRSLVDLRTRERKLIRDMEDGIDPLQAERITVNQLFDRYISQKYDLKPTTKSHYNYIYNHFIRDSFGRRRVSDIRYTDVKKYYYSIIIEQKMKACTLENVHTLLHPSFQMAVRDGVIRNNPTDGIMGEIKKSRVWDKGKRRSLTIPEQKAFMTFLYESRDFMGWRSVVTILLGTGMRIGECLGLRWEDLDFNKRTISINHSMVYRNIDGEGSKRHISTPKTLAGTRTIPMLQEVYDAFLEEYQLQSITGFCRALVDGYSGFVFANAAGQLTIPEDVNRGIHRIHEAYNKEEIAKAKKEKREPFLLPDFSAHHLRHTFCTRFCENETNLKVIQSIMGHSDITTTMDIYADVTEEKKQEVIYNMENKILVR